MRIKCLNACSQPLTVNRNRVTVVPYDAILTEGSSSSGSAARPIQILALSSSSYQLNFIN